MELETDSLVHRLRGNELDIFEQPGLLRINACDLAPVHSAGMGVFSWLESVQGPAGVARLGIAWIRSLGSVHNLASGTLWSFARWCPIWSRFRTLFCWRRSNASVVAGF